MAQVEIRYHRLPDRLDIFVQELVVDRPDCKITLHEGPPLAEPLTVGDSVILEPGAAIVWFVFPGNWYDIGRFHLRNGVLTGYYVNFIAPPRLEGNVWTMYDLCLDLWIAADGELQVLDRDEFDEAVDRLWIDAKTARHTRQALDSVISDVSSGRWPPALVREYDLERVRSLRHAEPS